MQPLLRELDKTRPDRQALLRQAFRFPRDETAKLVRLNGALMLYILSAVIQLWMELLHV